MDNKEKVAKSKKDEKFDVKVFQICICSVLAILLRVIKFNGLDTVSVGV